MWPECNKISHSISGKCIAQFINYIFIHQFFSRGLRVLVSRIAVHACVIDLKLKLAEISASLVWHGLSSIS